MRPRDERVGGRGRASSPSEAPRGGAHARRAGLEARARGSDPRGGARARARASAPRACALASKRKNPGEDTAVCVRAPGRLCDNRFAGRGRRGRGLRHAPRPTRPRWSRRRPRPPSRRPPTERTPPLPARLRSPPRPCSHLPPRLRVVRSCADLNLSVTWAVCGMRMALTLTRGAVLGMHLHVRAERPGVIRVLDLLVALRRRRFRAVARALLGAGSTDCPESARTLLRRGIRLRGALLRGLRFDCHERCARGRALPVTHRRGGWYRVAHRAR